jgi:hypothetical protein
MAEKHTETSGVPWMYSPDGAGLSAELIAHGLLT